MGGTLERMRVSSAMAPVCSQKHDKLIGAELAGLAHVGYQFVERDIEVSTDEHGLALESTAGSTIY